MTQKPSLPPYYFPTTVVFIDDDESFLDNLSVWLPRDLAFRMYTQPHAALAHIREVTRTKPISEQCFTINQAPQGAAEHTLQLNFGPISEALYTEQRFSEVSVAVVDYDMPALNGLEVGRQLLNTPIKKVLLTGKADEKIAVEAFNSGLIDRFISKGSPRVGDQLLAVIKELQQAYFTSASRPISGALQQYLQGFLSDPAFTTYFDDLQQQQGWVEYYLSIDPVGLLCLDADGIPALLLVSNRAQIEQSYRTASDLGASTDLLALIKRGEVIHDVPNGTPAAIDWRRHIHLAQPIPGSADCFAALVEQPSSLKYQSDRLLNYRYYLEILDYMQRAPKES